MACATTQENSHQNYSLLCCHHGIWAKSWRKSGSHHPHRNRCRLFERRLRMRFIFNLLLNSTAAGLVSPRPPPPPRPQPRTRRSAGDFAMTAAFLRFAHSPQPQEEPRFRRGNLPRRHIPPKSKSPPALRRMGRIARWQEVIASSCCSRPARSPRCHTIRQTCASRSGPCSAWRCRSGRAGWSWR